VKNLWRGRDHLLIGNTLRVVNELLTMRRPSFDDQRSRSRVMLSSDAWSAISAVALVFLVGLALVG
jgi:hypothetical protein